MCTSDVLSMSSKSENWNLVFECKSFYIKKEGVRWEQVEDIKAGKIGSIQVINASGKTSQWALKDFESTQCKFDILKGKVLQSRSKFVDAWGVIKDQMKNKSTDLSLSELIQNEDSQSSDTGSDIIDNDCNEDDERIHDIPITDCLVGECIDVHISNLKEPMQERLFRNIDPAHVEEIKESLKKSPVLFNVFAGNVALPKRKPKDIKSNLLKTENYISIETIGGNHTRQAILELLKENPVLYSNLQIVKCTVYLNLTVEESLRLGHQHNLTNDLGKPTCAEDLLYLFRKEFMRLTKGESHGVLKTTIIKWHRHLNFILGLDKDSRELHNKHKTLLSLARSNVEVWDKLCDVLKAFSAKQLKGQPRGVIKTSHLKTLGTLGDNERLTILNAVLAAKSWKEMPTEQHRNKKKNEPSLTKDDSDVTPLENLDTSMEALKSENGMLKREVERVNKKLEDANCELRRTQTELESKIIILKKNNTDQAESIKMYTFELDKIKETEQSISQTFTRSLEEKNVEIELLKKEIALLKENNLQNKKQSKKSSSNETITTVKDVLKEKSSACNHKKPSKQQKGSETATIEKEKVDDECTFISTFVCDFCDKVFISESCLEDHINNIHLGTKDAAAKRAKKTFWEYTDEPSVPKKAFVAAEGPRKKSTR